MNRESGIKVREARRDGASLREKGQRDRDMRPRSSGRNRAVARGQGQMARKREAIREAREAKGERVKGSALIDWKGESKFG